MTTVIYTHSAVPNPTATAYQRAECLAFAGDLGLEVTDAHSDDGGRRPALARLIAAAEAGTVTAVIVTSIDRFGRTITEDMRTVDAFRSARVTIYSRNEPRPGADPGLLLLNRQARARLVSCKD